MINSVAVTTFSPARWFEDRYRAVFCGLLLLAALTRAALIAGSPRPFGYAWDLYHEAVILACENGRLPRPEDCFACYYPPLYVLVGAPLYSLGTALSGGDSAGGLRVLCLLSLACACVFIYFCHRTLRLLRPPPRMLLLGAALTLALPCLFIGSYGAENDTLLAALMAAFFYRLCLWHLHPARSSWREPVLLGLLAGLCALTKYSGLLTLVLAAGVMGPRLARGRRRARAARDLLIVVSTALVVCGWHYAGNLYRRHRLFLTPPGVADEFNGGAQRVARHWRRYDFASFQVREVLDLYRADKKGTLNDFPVYRSVPTALHALAWTDMSLFSVPGRHGWTLPLHYGEGGGRIALVAETLASDPHVAPYPAKRVPVWLVALVLRLGVIPSALALLGFAATWRRRALRPFALFAAITLGVYAWWFLGLDAWALKTKYILFLLPVYVADMVLGLRVLERQDPRLGRAAAACLIAALLVSEAYLWTFALG